MCRITGFWDFRYQGEYPLEAIAEKMNDSLAYGGPDDRGVYVERESGLALGSRRLSIIDLSEGGHQPMFDDKKGIAVVFNGEIYNFQEIRKVLEQKGYRFISHSDTEVIIYAYREWGVRCVDRFRGMFGIAIWESRMKKLTVVRDRMGVKPLYFFWKDGLFMFASDVRAFLEHPKFKKTVNPVGVMSFLKYGYVVAPHAIWSDTYKLPPGSYLELVAHGAPAIKKYWDLEAFYLKGLERGAVDEAVAIEELEGKLIESFQLRMVSDVPVGVFLSGGIDSTLVAALLQKTSARPLRTFTVGFSEKKFDESGWARKIATHLGTDHTQINCGIEDALAIIPQLPEIYSEPFGDSSAVPTSLVSKLAREKTKVILSGDGGDEFFGGYDKYWKMLPKLRVASRMSPIIKAAAHAARAIGPEGSFYKLRKLANVSGSNQVAKGFSAVASCFLDDEMRDIVNPDIFGSEIDLDFTMEHAGVFDLDPASLWMLADGKYYLPDDILAKVDRASMHVALESREPFLDQSVMEYAAALPLDLKIRNGTSKYILKRILERYMPREYFDRPKQGFSIPQKKWLLNDLKDMVDEYLSEDAVKKHGLLNYEAVARLKKNFYAGKNVNSFKIWYLLVFQLWAEQWL